MNKGNSQTGMKVVDLFYLKLTITRLSQKKTSR